MFQLLILAKFSTAEHDHQVEFLFQHPSQLFHQDVCQDNREEVSFLMELMKRESEEHRTRQEEQVKLLWELTQRKLSCHGPPQYY